MTATLRHQAMSEWRGHLDAVGRGMLADSMCARSTRKHLAKDKRDAVARLSVGFVVKFGRRQTADLVKSVLKCSETTAQHIIRRGIFLSVNQGTK